MIEKKLTDDDLLAAANLQRLWDQWQQKRIASGIGKLSQEKVGLEIGMSQGAISQYLRGTTPLGTEATLKFAKLMDVNPMQIRPDFVYSINERAAPTYIENHKDIDRLAKIKAMEFADKFERRLEIKMESADKAAIFEIITNRYIRMLKTGKSLPTDDEMLAEIIDFDEIRKVANLRR